MLVTDEGRNLCSRNGEKLNVKYIFVQAFDLYYFGNSDLHFCILSNIVGYKLLSSLMIIGIFMRAMTLEAAISVHS